MDVLLALPPLALGLLALVLVIQLSLMIWALVDLSRRSAAQVRGPKWLWVVIVVFGELIGPVVYLLAGRRPERVDVAPIASAPGRATAAADVLYGDVTPAVPPTEAPADAVTAAPQTAPPIAAPTTPPAAPGERAGGSPESGSPESGSSESGAM